MTTELAKNGGAPSLQMTAEGVEEVLLRGNLSKLSPSDRMTYYAKVCESLGLNPMTRPFQYITFQGNMILYAAKSCTEQLARIHGISLRLDEGREFRDNWIVRCTATDSSGRTADATGIQSIVGLKGQELGNKMMAAETKASRRAVLRLCGLGMLDETETETIEGAIPAVVKATGEIVRQPNTLPAPDEQLMAYGATLRGFETVGEFTAEVARLQDNGTLRQGYGRVLADEAAARGYEYDREAGEYRAPDTQVTGEDWDDAFPPERMEH